MAKDFRDSGWAWVIAGAGFWISLTCSGIIPSYGILYTSIINALSIAREDASVPLFFGNSFLGVGVCISGLLHGYFSIRSQAIIGSFLCFFGIILCCAVKNIYSLSFFFGVINGIGAGILKGCSLFIVCQYFVKYTTVATGLFCGGLSLSCFIYPHLMQELASEYGINGCLLITSAIALNSLAGSMLFRSPPRKAGNSGTHVFAIGGSKRRNNDLRTDYQIKKKSFCRHLIEQLKKCVDVLKYPMFHLITVSFHMFYFSYSAYLMIMPDNAMGLGIDKTQSTLLIWMFSMVNSVGRLTIGWIVDLGWIKVRILFVILYISLGTTYVATPFLTNYWSLSVSACLTGFVSGSIITNWSVCLNDYLGINLLFPAISISAVIYIFILLCMPYLIEYFKLIHGTYNAIFYMFGAMQFICCLLWLMEPLAMKLQRRILHLKSSESKTATGNGCKEQRTSFY